MRLAAVDIGSNTVQALVADAGAGGLTEVARHIETPALGVEVDRQGEIGERTDEALAAIQRVVELAARSAPERWAAAATAAVRRARDRERFVRLASRACGVEVHVLSEEQEARLSFLGVASAHASPGPWLMVDVGGASTELVGAGGRTVRWWRSVPVGSGVIAARRLSDPPRPGERRLARADALAALVGRPLAGVEAVVATGGTALYLPGVLGSSLGEPLDLEALEAAAGILGASRAEALAARLSLPPERIAALRAGVEILAALLEITGAAALRLSREGLPHGMALALAERGAAWHRPDAGAPDR